MPDCRRPSVCDTLSVACSPSSLRPVPACLMPFGDLVRQLLAWPLSCSVVRHFLGVAIILRPPRKCPRGRPKTAFDAVSCVARWSLSLGRSLAWGAPRCGRRLSLPALLARRAPLPAVQPPSLSLAPAALPRPCALTLRPFVRASRCGAFPLSLAFPPPGVRAPCGCTRPATHSRPLVRGRQASRARIARPVRRDRFRSGVAGLSACRGGYALPMRLYCTALRRSPRLAGVRRRESVRRSFRLAPLGWLAVVYAVAVSIGEKFPRCPATYCV